MSVILRKKLSKVTGLHSLYLDINHCKVRWPEFLKIHVNLKRPTPEDKEKLILAKQLRSKRELELIGQENGINDKNRKKADFVQWFAKYISNQKEERSSNTSALAMLTKYTEGRPLPFQAITPNWCVGFTDFMTRLVKNNSALTYVCCLFTAFEKAVKDDIIQKNPWRGIDKKDRLKKQDTIRVAYTMEQLNQLANTQCKIHAQVRQGYFFSCFTGLRWSDVNPLKWSEIITKTIDSVERWFLYFEQEKTEGIEYIPLSPQAVEILKQRQVDREAEMDESPYVFPFIKEEDAGGKKVWERVRYALKKWALATGFDPKKLHFHTGRHTFATNVLEHSPDGDLYTVSKLLGHKSIIPTQIYAKVRDKRRASAVESLPMLTFNLTQPDPEPIPTVEIPVEEPKKETKIIQLFPATKHSA